MKPREPRTTATTDLGYCPACAKKITATSHVAVDLKTATVQSINKVVAEVAIDVSPKVIGFSVDHHCGAALPDVADTQETR